ncbi:MAG: hypothetical protein KDC42_01785 [Ignavibacteriae bacterium]|nr:hypothetical protein [Ignavibacteriota bacterium]
MNKINSIFLLIIITLTFHGLSFAQSDSTYSFKTKNLSLRYYNTTLKDTLQIKDITSLKMTGDSVILRRAGFNIENLKSLRLQTGHGSFWTGAKNGAIAGGILGIFISAVFGEKLSAGSHGHPNITIFIPLFFAPISAIIGGVTGGLINICLGEYSMYDFSGKSSENKKTELKRLLSKYGKK